MTTRTQVTDGWTAMFMVQLRKLWQTWQGGLHDSEARAGSDVNHAHGVYGVLGEGYGAGSGNSPHEPR